MAEVHKHGISLVMCVACLRVKLITYPQEGQCYMRVLTSENMLRLERKFDESDPACRKNQLPRMNICKRTSHETIFQSIS